MDVYVTLECGCEVYIQGVCTHEDYCQCDGQYGKIETVCKEHGGT